MSTTYSNDCICIHGSSTELRQKYPSATGSPYTEHLNSPALGMAITLTDFYHHPDGNVGFKITRASLRAINPNGQDDSYAPPFDVYASVIVDDVADYGGSYSNMIAAVSAYDSKTWLFQKSQGVATWADNTFELVTPRKLNAPEPKTKKLYLIISLMAICTCDTDANTNGPSFILDITSYVPHVAPYIWRMQHDKDPSVSTGPLGWHLTRPFYICKTINGVKGWCSCEDVTKLAYDANGRKL